MIECWISRLRNVSVSNMEAIFCVLWNGEYYNEWWEGRGLEGKNPDSKLGEIARKQWSRSFSSSYYLWNDSQITADMLKLFVSMQSKQPNLHQAVQLPRYLHTGTKTAYLKTPHVLTYSPSSGISLYIARRYTRILTLRLLMSYVYIYIYIYIYIWSS